MSEEIKEPDWKEVSFALASIIDDIDLSFRIYGMADAGSVRGNSPYDSFHIKKMIEFNKYFVRYKNSVLPIGEYHKQKAKDDLMMQSLMTSFKIKE